MQYKSKIFYNKFILYTRLSSNANTVFSPKVRVQKCNSLKKGEV